MRNWLLGATVATCVILGFAGVSFGQGGTTSALAGVVVDTSDPWSSEGPQRRMKMKPRRRKVRDAVVANEAVLLWRAVEPAYECGPDAQTHNELSPQHDREHA